MCDTQDQTEKITRAWWHGAVRAGRLEGGVGAMKTRLCQALLTASVRPVIGRGRRARPFLVMGYVAGCPSLAVALARR